MEKMLLTAALDERDLLVKKINDKISKCSFTDLKKNNEEKTYTNHVTTEEYKSETEAAYQQILDFIARYHHMDAAIVEANANTMVHTTKGDYTIAAAISLRNSLRESSDNNCFSKDFNNTLLLKMKSELESNLIKCRMKNAELDKTAESMRLSILGKDTKVKDDKPLEVVNSYIKENTTEVIDPLNVSEKIKALSEYREELLKELEIQIKVANATTYIRSVLLKNFRKCFNVSPIWDRLLLSTMISEMASYAQRTISQHRKIE